MAVLLFVTEVDKMQKKIAQKCLYCKEVFITEKRLEICPFCNKELPKEQKQKQKVFDKITEQPSTEIIKEFVIIQEEVQSVYNLVYGFLAKNNEQLKSKQLNSEDLCDFGFLCRELENLFDELRKEVKARKDLCGQIIAYRLVQNSLSDPTIKMRIDGQLAVGIPDVKMEAGIPNKFTEEYYQLTNYFGVPRKVAEAGILRLDWKMCSEFLTKQMNEGKQIPKGFGKQYPKYITTYRKKREK